MTTDPTSSAPVSKAARRAAVRAVPDDGSHGAYMLIDAISHGRMDDAPQVQAFARFEAAIRAECITPVVTDPTSSEVEQRALIARCIIGPRLPVPATSKVSLEGLREVRWSQSSKAEQQNALNAADAIIAALRTGSGVADGYVLVPVEPTEAMREAGWMMSRHHKPFCERAVSEDIWSAMLAAAKEPAR